jgi:hypothetical protein
MHGSRIPSMFLCISITAYKSYKPKLKQIAKIFLQNILQIVNYFYIFVFETSFINKNNNSLWY